jgi:uncharacterized membrane protein YfcA
VELVLFAIWCFAVAVVGGLVGLVLGNLRLPATLLVAGSPAAGTGANLVASAAAAATATIAHLRGGRVDWRLFAWMAPPSIVGAALGGYLSGVMPKRLLLGFITLVMLHAAWELFRWQPRGAGDAAPAEGGFDKRAAVLTGGIVGVLGGVVGLILGSLRMPALLRYVHVPVARAAGTNVAVGFCVGVAGALGHLPSEAPDWTVAAVGVAASIPGAWLGSHLTGRLSEPDLIRALAWILVVVATATGIEAVA